MRYFSLVISIDYDHLWDSNGGIYIDSGANIGQWIIYLGDISKLKLMAFEPVRSERIWLKECVGHQENWNVDIIECGLSNETTSLDILVDGPRSTLQLDWYGGNNFRRETIDVIRLDDFLDRQNIDNVDF